MAARLPTHPVRYRIKDLNSSVVFGSYYDSEIIPSTLDDDTAFVIDRVIRWKVLEGEKHVLVQWKHYSDKFNSWIPAASIHIYK